MYTSKLFIAIKRILFPYQCLACNKYGNLLCSRCVRNKISIRHTNTDSVAFFPYTDTHIREIIGIAKYKRSPDVLELFAPTLAEYIFDMYSEKSIINPRLEIILIPVPSSKKRLSSRGYNQSAILASYISLTLKNNYSVHATIKDTIVTRIKDTQLAHVKLKNDRLNSIRDAFIQTEKLNGNNLLICIIDDVITTGATTSELKRILAHDSFEQVEIVAIAH